MKITSRTRDAITALLLVFSSLASNLSYAQQTINLNGTPCSTATVSFGANVINIATGACIVPIPMPPSIASLSVTSGLPNAALTISGANFTGATVTIGGANASITSNTGSTIVTSVPATATPGVGTVVVTVSGFTAASVSFTVLVPPPPAAPIIATAAPLSASVGTPVTITGANFSGASVVTIGGASAAFTSPNGTTISTSVPAGAALGLGAVTVTVPGFTAASAPFTVVAPPPPASPAIISVTPLTGPVGTPVTIAGSAFTGATVSIGGATATILTSSATSIATTVPAGATLGAGLVVVTVPGLTPASSAFTVTTAVAGDVSIEGVTLANPSKSAFVPGPVHAGANGAGPEVNAWAMPPSRCMTTTTAPITRSWQHNIDLEDYKSKNAFDFFVLQANEALSYKFTLGSVQETGGFVYNDATNATVRPTVMSISSAPCQFDTAKLVAGTLDACVQTGINGNVINYASIIAPTPPAYCRLQIGQTYYFNIRFQDGRGGNTATDSCTGGNCGGFIQLFK